MQQPQQRVERVGQHALGHGRGRLVLQPRLDHLDVEAAELVPGEVVEHPGRVGEVIFVQRRRSPCSVTVASRLRSQRSSSASSSSATGRGS